MQKQCLCGEMMAMKLRTVIYSGKVEIDNVPVYACPACSRNEVFPEVKPDLTGLIDQLGTKPGKGTLLFNEWNEWADLLVEAVSRKRRPDPGFVSRMREERINRLLDLYLVAQSLDDEEWISELGKRLAQLSKHSMHT